MKKHIPVYILTLLFSLIVSLRKIPLGKGGEWIWKYYKEINFWWRAFFPLGIFLLIYPLFLLYRKWKIQQSGKEPSRRQIKLSLYILLALLLIFTFLVKISFQYLNPLGLEGNIIVLSYPWISGYFTESQVMKMNREYFSDYPDKVTYYHPKLHPPLMTLLCRGTTKLFYYSPFLTRSFLTLSSHSILDARGVFQFLENKEKWHLRDYQKAALIFMGILLPFLSSLGIIPLFLLLRKEKNALPLTLLYPFIPSLLLFSPTLEEFLPLFVILSLYFFNQKNRTGYFLSGLSIAIGSLFSLSLLLILPFILLFERNRDSSLYLYSLSGFLATIFLFQALTGFSLFKYLFHLLPAFTEKGRVAYLGIAAPGRSYFFWIFYNPFEFFTFVGIPLSYLFFLGLPSLSPSNKLAFLGVFVFLNFSGISLSEVGRLWIFLSPLLFLSAAKGANKIPTKQLFLFPLLQFIQALLMKGSLDIFTLFP
ncbi:MAG: hypothetical protein GXO71_08130 [Caldiserica bacterium]|nr:hypothetical protein [Caldisericota bacterium]